MIKRYLKKILPNAGKLSQDSNLASIQKFLSNPALWSINRKSVSRGVAIGLLIAFVPLPMQMLLAALLAIYFSANLPVAIALTWITNPITFVPINYFIYCVGRLITDDSSTYRPLAEFNFSWHYWRDITQNLFQGLHDAGKPFLVGLPIVAISASLLGYIIIHILWRLAIYWYLTKRKKRLP